MRLHPDHRFSTHHQFIMGRVDHEAQHIVAEIVVARRLLDRFRIDRQLVRLHLLPGRSARTQMGELVRAGDGIRIGVARFVQHTVGSSLGHRRYIPSVDQMLVRARLKNRCVR